MLNLLESFSEHLIDEAALVRKSPPAEKEARRDHIAGTQLLQGKDHNVKDKEASVIGTKTKPRGDHNVFTHFPKDPIVQSGGVSSVTCHSGTIVQRR